MTDEEALKRWPDLDSDERDRRRKLSEAASARHAEIVDPESGRRKFGGPQPGSGRPKRQRVAEAVAELARTTRQKEVVDAMFSGLKPRNDPKVRVATAEKIVKIENEERKLQLKEDSFKDDPRDELLRYLLPRLKEASERGELPDPRAPRKDFDVEGSVAPEE